MKKARILIDTSIILEAIRINCWDEICQQYAIETAEKCIEETLLTSVGFAKNIACIHKPNKKSISSLRIFYPQTQCLDTDELHLFSTLYEEKTTSCEPILIATADKAAMYVIETLGYISSIISLEELAIKSGVAKSKIMQAKSQYKTKWVDDFKLNLYLTSYIEKSFIHIKYTHNTQQNYN